MNIILYFIFTSMLDGLRLPWVRPSRCRYPSPSTPPAVYLPRMRAAARTGRGPMREGKRGRGRDRGAGTGRVRVGGPAPLLCRGEGPGDDVPAEGAVVAQQRRDAAAVAQLHRQAQPPLAPLRLPVPYFIYIYIYIYNM